MRMFFSLLMICLLLMGCAGKKADKMEWKYQKSGTDENIVSISFGDKKHGWAVTDNGSLLSTEDAGENWTISKISDKELTSVYAIDKKTIWIAGMNGSLYTSMEGSSSMQDRSLEPDVDFLEIAFWDEDNGIIVGNRMDRDSIIIGVVYRTDDGGQQWSEVYAAIDRITSMSTLGKGLGWIGTTGTIWTSKDYGANWDENYLGETISNNSMYFDKYSTGLLVGDSGTFYMSLDGGWSWDDRGGEFPEQKLNSITFVDRFIGLIVGNNGTILISSLSGDKWGFNNSLTSSHLYDIASHGKTMWVCGADGTILMVK